MTRPYFAGIIERLAIICVSTNMPLRLTATSLSQASSGWSSAGEPQVAPALFTRMSTLPYFFRIASATGAMASRLPMSQGQAAASIFCLANCATAASSSSCLRAVSTTLAPISPRASAICRPSPREPPVTTATRPLRSKSFLTLMPAPLVCRPPC